MAIGYSAPDRCRDMFLAGRDAVALRGTVSGRTGTVITFLGSIHNAIAAGWAQQTIGVATTVRTRVQYRT